MYWKKQKKVIVVLVIAIVLSGFFYYIQTDSERLKYQNYVEVNFTISLTMLNQSTGECNYYLPGYINKDGDFLDIYKDFMIEGNGTIINRIETIHGPAIGVVANGSFSLLLNKTYYNILSINETSLQYQTFWKPSLYDIDIIVPQLIVGHQWIYYNGTDCDDKIMVSIYELSIFRYGYSGLYYSQNTTSYLTGNGWIDISSNRTVLSIN